MNRLREGYWSLGGSTIDIWKRKSRKYLLKAKYCSATKEDIENFKSTLLEFGEQKLSRKTMWVRHDMTIEEAKEFGWILGYKKRVEKDQKKE